MKKFAAVLLAMSMIATPLSVLSGVVSSTEITPVTPLGGGTFGGGDGSIGNPYIIEDALDLQAISGNLNAHYALGNDIDASATVEWNGGQGFNPIGVTMARFNGTFDGHGHKITEFYINRPFTTSVGLFGNIGLGATISNVTVENAAVTGYDGTGILVGTVYAPTGQVFNAAVSGIVVGRNGTGGLVGFLGSAVGMHNCSSSASVSGNGYVGGLVGEARDPITDCTASGSVVGKLHGIGGLVGRMWDENITRSHATGAVSTNTSVGLNIGGLVGEQSFVSSTFDSYATGDVTGWGYLGGLVGYFRGDIIRDSHATGDVSSPQNVYRVGGLVGTVGDGSYPNCIIYRCYATGNVDGGTRCGGLLGSMNHEVSECYATGDVDSTGLSGGLVGVLEDPTSNATDCYATGEVSSSLSDRVGGLVGVSMATITNCYASGPVSGPAPIGGLISSDGGGLGIEVNCFWDTTTSGIATSVGSETGLTTAQMMTQTTFTGAGWDFTNTWWMVDGQTRPFLRTEWSQEITNSHQLQLMAMDLTADYTLENDIALNDIVEPSQMWGTNPTSGKGFWPVGRLATPFIGSFSGLNHTISAFYLNRPSENNIALFGYTNANPLFSHVSIVGADITGNEYSAILCGATSGNIDHVDVSGDVAGSNYVGGISGFNGGTISNCTATGNVNGTNIVGGIVGSNQGPISDCYATGIVNGTYAVGGLVGEGQNPSSVVYNCTAHGYVFGTSFVGGLIGMNNGTVNASFADGMAMAMMNYSGGLMGFGSGDVVNSHAAGIVSGYNYVGGLIGSTDGAVSSCYATGNISGAGYVGGLCGYTTAGSIVSQSYATGAVNGSSSCVGGLVGKQEGSAISNCYAKGNVIGGAGNGGFVGDCRGNVTNCYSTGTVSNGVMYYAGFIGILDYAYNVTDCFWDTETSGWTDGTGSDPECGAIGCTTVEMMQQSTFTNWSFTTIWGIHEANTYPFLRVFGTPAEPQADLEVTLDDNVDPVMFGDVLTYHGTLTNHGPANAADVKVNITLPPEVTLLNISAGMTVNGRYITGNPGIMASGDIQHVFINVTVNPFGTGGQTLIQLSCTAFAISNTSDPGTYSNSSTEITIVNRVPVGVNNSYQTYEDYPFAAAVLGDDFDPDLDPITVISHENSDFGAAIEVYANGSFTYDPTVSATLQALHSGVSVNDTFNYTISDGRGGTATATITMQIDGQNAIPTAVNDTYTLIEDSGAYVLNVLLNDLSDEEADTITISSTSTQWQGTFAITGGGTGLEFTPIPNYFGTFMFNYTVDDGYYGTDSASVTMTVTGVNDAPVIGTIVNDDSVLENESYSWNYTGDDLVDGDTVTWTLVSGATWLSINSTTGVLSGIPPFHSAGNYSVNITLGDGHGGADWLQFTLTVLADTDGDGITDVIDTDKDGDDVPNGIDDFPLDPDESVDTDDDGIGNNADTDDDGDDIPDAEDSDPLVPDDGGETDTDDDGVPDDEDAFPDDPAASVDTDGDGMPDAWNEGYTEQDSTTGLVLDDDPLVADEEGGNMMLYLVIIIVIVVVIAAAVMLARKKPMQPAESPAAEPTPAKEPETATDQPPQ